MCCECHANVEYSVHGNHVCIVFQKLDDIHRREPHCRTLYNVQSDVFYKYHTVRFLLAMHTHQLQSSPIFQTSHIETMMMMMMKMRKEVEEGMEILVVVVVVVVVVVDGKEELVLHEIHLVLVLVPLDSFVSLNYVMMYSCTCDNAFFSK